MNDKKANFLANIILIIPVFIIFWVLSLFIKNYAIITAVGTIIADFVFYGFKFDKKFIRQFVNPIFILHIAVVAFAGYMLQTNLPDFKPIWAIVLLSVLDGILHALRDITEKQ